MRRNLPARFWFEAINAALGLAMTVLTLITREWLEPILGFDPDGGSGALEMTVASACSPSRPPRHSPRAATTDEPG